MIDAISSFTGRVRTPGATSETSATTSVAPARGAASVGAASFTDVLSEVAQGAVSALKTGEATAISGVQGKASVQRVVEAIMSAEQSLQTAVAVRDKVVAAYQEVSRMAI